MPKIYQARYKNNEKTSRHSGASQTKVEKEAKLTAEETGTSVFVEVLEIEKPSLKLIIGMLNGEGPLSRTKVCVFQPREEVVEMDASGETTKRWKVKRVVEGSK